MCESHSDSISLLFARFEKLEEVVKKLSPQAKTEIEKYSKHYKETEVEC